MIKFYKETSEGLLAALYALRKIVPDYFEGAAAAPGEKTPYDLYERVNGSRWKFRTYYGSSTPVTEDEDVNPHTITNFIKLIEAQLSAEVHGPTGERLNADLFDVVVDMLRLPFAPNRIGTKALNALRKALLTHGELESLKAALQTSEMACSGCNKNFEPGELTTFIQDTQEGNKIPIVMCLNCVMPTVHAFADGVRRPLTSSLLRKLRKDCKTIPQDAPVGIPEDVQAAEVLDDTEPF